MNDWEYVKELSSNDFVEEDGEWKYPSEGYVFMFIHSEWCPYSISMREEWGKLGRAMKGTNVKVTALDGYTLQQLTPKHNYDSPFHQDDTQPTINPIISGFPTIDLLKDGVHLHRFHLSVDERKNLCTILSKYVDTLE